MQKTNTRSKSVKKPIAKQEKSLINTKKVEAAPVKKGKGGKQSPIDQVFRDEVDRILVKHWQVEEPAQVIKWDYNRVLKVKAPKNDNFYIIKARGVNSANKSESNIQKESEERQMKFVNFLASKNLPVGGYVSQGVLTLKNIQVMVTQMVPGGVISDQHIKEKSALIAIGDWLAQFHQASRMFSKQFPDVAAKFPQWNKDKWSWQKDKLTPPGGLEQDELNYGLIHADFHPGNWHIYKTNKRCELGSHEACEQTTEISSHNEETKENKSDYQINAFDWDNVQHCWFLVDLGCVVFELAWRIAREANPTSELSTIVERQQQICNQLCQAYETKTQDLGYPNYKINREHLRACCDMRRDFVKQVFNWWIPGCKDDGKKRWLQDYVKQVDQGYFQHYEVCHLPKPKDCKKYLKSMK